MSVYLTFDEMREALGLSEDELKQLVAKGEIRAFRRGSRMVFRASDIDDLRHRFRQDVEPPLPRGDTRADEHVETLADRAAEPAATPPPADDIPVARLAESEDPSLETAEPTVRESRPPREVVESAPSVSLRDAAYVIVVALIVAVLLALMA